MNNFFLYVQNPIFKTARKTLKKLLWIYTEHIFKAVSNFILQTNLRQNSV